MHFVVSAFVSNMKLILKGFLLFRHVLKILLLFYYMKAESKNNPSDSKVSVIKVLFKKILWSNAGRDNYIMWSSREFQFTDMKL